MVHLCGACWCWVLSFAETPGAHIKIHSIRRRAVFGDEVISVGRTTTTTTTKRDVCLRLSRISSPPMREALVFRDAMGRDVYAMRFGCRECVLGTATTAQNRIKKKKQPYCVLHVHTAHLKPICQNALSPNLFVIVLSFIYYESNESTRARSSTGLYTGGGKVVSAMWPGEL